MAVEDFPGQILPCRPGIYAIETSLGVYVGQTFSLAKRRATHLKAAIDGSHKNPLLASCLNNGDFRFRVVEVVEMEFPTRRHLRSFLLGREAYWMSKSASLLNIYPPERPALDPTAIQAKLGKLKSDRSSWEKQSKTWVGFSKRAFENSLASAESELEAFERQFKRELGVRSLFEPFLPSRFRVPISTRVLEARKKLLGMREDRAARDRAHSYCMNMLAKLDQEISDQKFIGFQCGVAIDTETIVPLKKSEW